MAGNYPDVPGLRMPYDRDGTTALYLNETAGSVISELTTTQLDQLNDETVADGFTFSFGGNVARSLVFFFPEARDLVGYCSLANDLEFALLPVHTSANSTNGLDGTWTTHANWQWSINDKQLLRESIVLLSAVGIKAVKFNLSVGTTARTDLLMCHHMYGSISSGESPDRLRIWHPTLDQEVGGAYFDWGNVPRGSSADRTFRVKNNSAALTANNIVLSMETPSDTSPSVGGQHTFSPDGSTFTATLNIGSLAPGAISSAVTLRRVTPSDATLSLWWTRIVAAATTWT